MLFENSLYSTPARRDELLKEKNAVMNALCINLLGFLGCFKLADSRAALKTYDQTEGQLRLGAIGDNNHDVSLSLKLADEAGVISNSGAQNVTKLLYKIKSKQIKGKDLDDDQVRDLIKTLKISSHPGDNVINAVVSEFEAGSLNLGQAAQQLFRLAKLPKYKEISGEFRTLVTKGQYQELFAKLGTPAPVSAKISNNTSVKVATPVAAPVVTTHISGPFTSYPQDEQDGLYEELFFSKPPVSSRTLPKACVNAGLTEKQMPSVLEGYAGWVHKQVFVEKKYSDFTAARCSELQDFIYKTDSWWLNLSAKNRFLRSFVCGRWMTAQPDIERGELGELTTFTNQILWDLKMPATNDCLLPIFTEEFFRKIANDDMLIKVANASYGEFTVALNDLISAAWVVSGGAYGSDYQNQLTEKCASWKFDKTLGEWWVRARASKLSAIGQYVIAVYHVMDDQESIAFLNRIFKIEPPATCAIISPDSNPNRANILVPIDLKTFGLAASEKKIVDEITKPGVKPSLYFVDLANWGTEFKKKVKEILGSPINNETWDKITATALQTLGMPKGYISTEPFLVWFVDQLEGSRAVALFKMKPSANLSGVLYMNAGIQLLDTKGVSPGVWLSLYTFVLTWLGINNEQYQKDLEAIYEENSALLESSLASVFSTNSNKLDYSTGSVIAAFLLKMHKAKKFKAPNDRDFWVRLAQFSASELGEWEVPNEMQKELWALNLDIDQKAIRKTLLSKYEFTRQWYYTKWLDERKNKDPKYTVSDFIDFGYTDVVSEDQIPKATMDFVKAALPDLQTHIRLFDSLGNGYGEWLKDLVKNALKDALDKNLLSLVAFENCIKTLGPEAFNEFVSKQNQTTVIDRLKVINPGMSRDTVFMWQEIAKDARELTIDTLTKMLVSLGMNIQNSKMDFSPEDRKTVSDCICNMLNDLSSHGRESDVDKLFDSMSYSVDLKKIIIEWFSKAGVLSNALKAIKGEEIAPLIEVDQARLGTLMKYNNINVPTAKDVDYKRSSFQLSDFLKTHGSWKLEPLATSTDIDDQASLDRRTAEYDVFNKYRHGQIGVKFIKSFNVDLPIQRDATEKWDKDHPRGEIMDPVFHGTGSVAASFILRYGFAVISSADASVVGRMLGDGVYFSNVLDKCGQYVSDGGYSRGKGNKGYLFQMRANLGARGTDYQAGGGNLVSPEWCVFHPNSQLKIYKAHFIELVDKNEIQIIKKKVMKLNESTAIRIYEMTEHLNPELMSKGCVSYTFIDGTIPTDETTVVDFEHWDPTVFGPHVTMEASGLGPIVYIQVDDPSVAEMYAVRYTSEFMNQGDDFTKFLSLLRGGQPI